MTVVLCNKALCINGFAECDVSDGSLVVNYTLNIDEVPGGHVYKLYAYSSRNPDFDGIAVDTPEFISKTSSGKKEFSKQYLSEYGIKASEIDTIVLTDKNLICGDQSLVAVGFINDEWDINEKFRQRDMLNKMPLKRGAEVIEKIKKQSAPADPSICSFWRDVVTKSCVGHSKSGTVPSEDYEWYIYQNLVLPVPLGAYEHLICSGEFASAFVKTGEYLFGLSDGGHTALAIRSDDINPFENADDCSEKYGDYYVVGVYLGEDGQYFEKIR